MWRCEALVDYVQRYRYRELSGLTTPASALGLPLVERLRASGMTFDVKRR